MPLISLWQRRDHAAEHGYGVSAFNNSSMEQGLAIMNAARASDVPLILAELEVSARDRFERSGTAWHGASIRVIPLPGMAPRCEEGVLDRRVAAA